VPSVERSGSNGVRIPRSGSNDQHGAELRRTWVHDVSSAPQRIDGVVSPKWEAEIDSALSLLASSLARLLRKSDLLWEVLGHGIPILITPPSPQRAPKRRSLN